MQRPHSSRKESNIQLETNFVDTFAYVAATIVFMMTGFVLSYVGYRIGWFIGIVPSVLLVYLIHRQLSTYSSLLLSPGGFTYRSQNESFSFRWTDVERFSLHRGAVFPVVIFSLTASARSQGRDSHYRLQSASMPDDVIILKENYGLGAKQFCALLNDWRVKYADRSNRVVVFA